MRIDLVKLLLELNTLLTGLVVQFGTRLDHPAPLGFNATDAETLVHAREELVWMQNAVAGDIAFLVLLLSIILHFVLLQRRCTLGSRETRHQVSGVIASLRMVSVFPFTFLVLLYKTQDCTGFNKLWGLLSLIWVVLYVAHLILTPALEVASDDEARRAEIAMQLRPVDEDRGREVLSGMRREVPGDAVFVDDEASHAAEDGLPRACHTCNDALPNTRCRPCQHSSTCEPCLLRWASLAMEGCCRCPVCGRMLEGYDVAAEPGAYFLHTFVEGTDEDCSTP